MGVSANFKGIFLKHYRASESPRVTVKHLFPGSNPADSDSAVLGRSLRISVSNTHSGRGHEPHLHGAALIQTLFHIFISLLFSFYCNKYSQKKGSLTGSDEGFCQWLHMNNLVFISICLLTLNMGFYCQARPSSRFLGRVVVEATWRSE